jgi:hypothetical protein
MKKRWVCLSVLLALFALALSGAAAQVSGTIGAAVQVLPSFSAESDVAVTISAEDWSIWSDTTFSLIPDFGIDEYLSLSYTMGIAAFSGVLSVGVVPWSFGYVDLSAAITLFDTTLNEKNPVLSALSTLTLGATIDGGFDPYATLYGRLSLDQHWIASTTTLSLASLDLASGLLAYLSLGSVTLGDGENSIVVSAYGYVSQDLVPFAFSYAQLNAKVVIGAVSLLNTVTYYGGASFAAKSTATVTLDSFTLTIWSSYTSTASDPFGLGASVSIPWGPIQ